MFSEKFWQSVRQTSEVIKPCLPLCDSEEVDQLRQNYQNASPEVRAHLKHELGMLIARLIQVDRLLN